MKQCSKCKELLDESNFGKNKNRKNGLDCWCKECKREYRDNNKEWRKEYDKKRYENNKEKMLEDKRKYYENNEDKVKERMQRYYENHKEKIKEQHKEYKENNKEKVREWSKEWCKNNKEKLKENKREYYSSLVPFNSTANSRQEIELYEDIEKSSNGNLMCKCVYCGDWFEPSKLQIQSRLNAINGIGSICGDGKLYCSDNCKNNCPVYNQKLYARDQKPMTSREVQPQLRQIVFIRDEYTCQKCNTHRDNLEVGIQCHHKEGIQWEPLQSADTDMCITYCEDCHKEVHSIDGCGYSEMKCA